MKFNENDDCAPETCGACDKTGFSYNCGNNSIYYSQICMLDDEMNWSHGVGFVCYDCCSKNERNEDGFQLLFISTTVKQNRTDEQILAFANYCFDSTDDK